MRLHLFTLDEREAMRFRDAGWKVKRMESSEWELTWNDPGWPGDPRQGPPHTDPDSLTLNGYTAHISLARAPKTLELKRWIIGELRLAYSAMTYEKAEEIYYQAIWRPAKAEIVATYGLPDPNEKGLDDHDPR